MSARRMREIDAAQHPRSGLELPSEGEIFLDGGKTVDRKAVGYVMQNDNLYPWRTLRENVEFPLELQAVPPADRRKTSQHYLEKVRLSGFRRPLPL